MKFCGDNLEKIKNYAMSLIKYCSKIIIMMEEKK